MKRVVKTFVPLMKMVTVGDAIVTDDDIILTSYEAWVLTLSSCKNQRTLLSQLVTRSLVE